MEYCHFSVITKQICRAYKLVLYERHGLSKIEKHKRLNYESIIPD